MIESQVIVKETDALILYIMKYLQDATTNTTPAQLQKDINLTFQSINRGKARSYTYSVIDHMKDKGWINAVENRLVLTEAGTIYQESLRDTYQANLLDLKSKTQHFYDFISGNKIKKHYALSKDQKRMFSRLVDVRSLTTFLILDSLRQDKLSGTDILKKMYLEHLWQPSNGYFFDIIRSLESDRSLLTGTWSEDRRQVYLYQLTPSGQEQINYFANQSRDSLKGLLHYIHFCLELLIS